MLILTRRVGETIVIKTAAGECIEVCVLQVKGNQVRLGSSAPSEVKILRAEIIPSDATLRATEVICPDVDGSNNKNGARDITG